MGENCEHGIKPASECPECSDRAAAVHACVEAAYAQGRADERAAVVAWLRASNKSRDYDLSTAIERGKHEVDAHQNDARAQEGEAVKKPRKTTPRERALVTIVREMLRAYDNQHRCTECWREADTDERHDETCIVTQMRRALRVR